MFGLLNNPLGCSPILLMLGGNPYPATYRASQRFERN